MNVHEWIDAFVRKVNATPLCFPDYAPDIWEEQAPEDGRVSLAVENRRVLVERLEEKLQHRFPKSFRSLLYRYTFPPFDVLGVMLFGWNDNSKHLQDNLPHSIFADIHLSQVLLTNGYIQIGRPDTGDYDAICFDTNKKIGDNEYSIVRIEHENVLIHDRIVITDSIAPSFYAFTRDFVNSV